MAADTKIASFKDVSEILRRIAPGKVPRPAYALEQMQRFMDFLGNPQEQLKVVHVAGTSGKTSTCYYTAALLHQAGKKTGLSVSPYVHEVNERVQIGLTPLAEQDFCDEFAIFFDLHQKSNIVLTQFELLTAFAFWEFARQKLDYAVMEVGMGGELDATNVVARRDKVCAITDIGLDHQNRLGTTLAEIATKKAAIIQLHNEVFVYRQAGEILDPVRRRAQQKQAGLDIVTPSEPPENLGFLPLFQQRNFGLAAEVTKFICERDGIKHLGDGALLRAAQTIIPARMEEYYIGDKIVILDGAHNPQKLTALTASLRHSYGAQPVAVLAAFKAGQTDRTEQSAAVLTGMANHIIATAYGDPASGDPYGEDPDTLAAMCKIHGFWDIEAIADPAHAWRQLLERPEPILVVTGSFYLFNEIYPLLRPI